jgi:PAS domain S-box-containing protein
MFRPIPTPFHGLPPIQDTALNSDDEARELDRLRAETKRLRAENEMLFDRLGEAERETEKLFLDNPLPMWVYDLETLAFLEVNQTAIQKYGYSREQFLAMSLADIRPPEDVPRMLETVNRRRKGHEYSGDWRHRLANGDIIHVEIASHTINFRGRRAVLVVARDVSDQRKLQADLRQAQRMEAVGRLASGIAHDFNNFLMVIGGHCELMDLALPAENALKRRVQLIEDAVERARELTEQLLTFTRKPRTELQSVALNDEVRTVHALLDQVIGNGITLRLDLSAFPDTIIADRTGIEQLLMNLCLNARDAMPDGGTLTLATRNRTDAPNLAPSPTGVFVELTVTDTGCGMTEDVLERIFDPFFTTKGDKGNGLGLSTAYGIVAQAGGEIRAESRPGEGTRFTILFPMEFASRTEFPALSGNARAAAPQPTVLIVEDEESVREILVETFELEGFTVLETDNGDEALLLCESHGHQIDVLVTDIVLPTISGCALADRLRKCFPDLGVLFVTGYAAPELIETGLPVLQKPFSITQLVETVEQIRDSRRRTVS